MDILLQQLRSCALVIIFSVPRSAQTLIKKCSLNHTSRLKEHSLIKGSRKIWADRDPKRAKTKGMPKQWGRVGVPVEDLNNQGLGH